MYRYTDHVHLVPFDGHVELDELPTAPPSRAKASRQLAEHVEAIAALQKVLYAEDSHAVLLVFQGMDAAGKDSTIRKVLSGVNPAGCHVTSFKVPSTLELEHDFLWRVHQAVPQRGHLGVFNRSHYEDVLVTRVHPELLERSLLRSRHYAEDIWDKRMRAIRSFEQHLADAGTVILKFYLHLGRDEQRRRFLARIDNPEKNWKFNVGDVEERRHWPAYRRAYQEALRETSRPWAPWYAIPADDKPYMACTVAEILHATLERLDLKPPVVDAARKEQLLAMRDLLMSEDA